MSVLFDVWLISSLTAGYLDDVLADSRLSGDDFGMYAMLSRFGPATPTQLRRWTGRSLTTVSAHVKRIDQRGHLERTPHPQDRRAQLLRLTELGAKAYQEATEPFLEAMHDLRRRFVPDALRERLVLQSLDAVLRDVTGMAPRPYQVTLEDASAERAAASGPHALAYAGAPLTSAQEQQVRLYIDFVRHQQS